VLLEEHCEVKISTVSGLYVLTMSSAVVVKMEQYCFVLVCSGEHFVADPLHERA